MASVSRRTALFASAFPVSCGPVPAPAGASITTLAAEYHHLTASLPRLDRARDLPARVAQRAEVEYLHSEDPACTVVYHLEAAPILTRADAEALRGVALALVPDGRDPVR